MKVLNLSNILTALQPLAVDGKVEVSVDSLKKRAKQIVAKSGEVYFQMTLDNVEGLKVGKVISVTIETAEVEITDKPPVKADGAVEPVTTRPGRSCSTPFAGNASALA